MSIKIYKCPMCGGDPIALMFTGDSYDDDKKITFGCPRCKIAAVPVTIPADLIKQTELDMLQTIGVTFAIVRWNNLFK